MGRWVGMLRFFRMMPSAILALVAGVIWDRVGPQYVFLVYLAVDIFIRISFLLKMPETLRLRWGVILDDYEALALEKRNQFEILKKQQRLAQSPSSCGKLRTPVDFHTVCGCL
jgi:hypothetical protein